MTGLGPPVPRCAFVGQGPVLPIVDGLEGSGTAKYAELPVVHSERKFQSHPAVPPARLIGPCVTDLYGMVMNYLSEKVFTPRDVFASDEVKVHLGLTGPNAGKSFLDM